MKAMIFAAGLGTRFKPWTDHHPKALAPVFGKSLLQHNIEYLQQYGFDEVVVNVHHFADQIEEAVHQNKGWGSKVIISDERNEVLETGGGLWKAREYLMGDEPFVTINVDILTDLNLQSLLEFHQSRQPLISFGVTNRKTARNFLFNETDQLCGWVNQQTGEQKISRSDEKVHPMAYSCVVVFEPKVFDLITQTGKFSLTETYLDLARTQSILGFDHSGDRLVDVGKPDSIQLAERTFPERN